MTEWATPIFEDTRVFSRSLGDTSDVVMKEMYSFQDRGGDSLTLRPEATAGICRALVSNGLTQSLPQKVFYTGPMFRYERPQKGRYRQFHQIDVEVLGSPEPLADAEVIACGWDILTALGIAARRGARDQHAGRPREPRRLPRRAGRLFHRPPAPGCPRTASARLERNPLRILDSKDEGDRRIIADAPTIYEHLTEAAATFYAKLRDYLTAFGVPFVENPRIVRGLDYYGHTAFEFVTSRLGAQGTVMGGGRYEGWWRRWAGRRRRGSAGRPASSGWPCCSTSRRRAPRPVAVMPVGEAAEARRWSCCSALRHAGIRAEMAYRGNLKRRMERANRIGARAAVILGETEIARGVAQVKDLDSGAQERGPARRELPSARCDELLARSSTGSAPARRSCARCCPRG